MTNLSVIILVGREERHIRRCLERLAPLEPRQVLVVESQHGDRTHEIAVETGRGLGWGIGEGKGRRKKEEGRSVVGEEKVGRERKEEGRRKKEEVWKGEEKVGRGGERKKEEGRGEKCGGRGENRSRGWDRRKMAEKKVEEWLDGVDEITFEAALLKLVDEKTAAGEFRFKKPVERELALAGARRFFREFSRKIIVLSDGRCVYFAPDPRSSARNSDNAVSWAEYAFHAVSNGGAKVEGKNYNERWYNPHKISAFALMDAVLKQERCFIRISSVDHRYDAIVFAGDETTSAKLQIVTRLDEVGNIDANLSEVTFTASSKEKKPPRLVPLTEAVRTVVHYQTTAGSYPPNESSIAFPPDENKVVRDEVGRGERVEGKCLNGEGKKVGRESRSTADGSSHSNNQTIKPSNNVRRALFVSRMHPKKGVLELVESWARVFKSKSRVEVEDRWVCELVYTLNGDAEREYEQCVKQRILELGMSYQDNDGTIHSLTSNFNSNSPDSNIQAFKHSNISSPDFNLTGSLDDDAKWEAYARADLFVLPTYSENFGIVVAEALWAGVPVITTKGTPWSDLLGVGERCRCTANDLSAGGRCGWWIELPEDGKTRSARDSRAQTATGCAREVTSTTDETWSALDEALREACGAEGLRALPAMGANGHRLVEEKYTWKAVVGAMVHGYEQVLNPCEFAPCDSCRNYGDTCPIR